MRLQRRHVTHGPFDRWGGGALHGEWTKKNEGRSVRGCFAHIPHSEHDYDMKNDNVLVNVVYICLSALYVYNLVRSLVSGKW